MSKPVELSESAGFHRPQLVLLWRIHFHKTTSGRAVCCLPLHNSVSLKWTIFEEQITLELHSTPACMLGYLTLKFIRRVWARVRYLDTWKAVYSLCPMQIFASPVSSGRLTTPVITCSLIESFVLLVGNCTRNKLILSVWNVKWNWTGNVGACKVQNRQYVLEICNNSDMLKEFFFLGGVDLFDLKYLLKFWRMV